MAKLECHLKGNYNQILHSVEDAVMKGSMTASKEGSSDYEQGDVKCAVRVYERYSALGGNRVSLNITLVGDDDKSFLTAITAGGSQALIFKINTWGEEAFLDSIRDVVKRYQV